MGQPYIDMQEGNICVQLELLGGRLVSSAGIE